jgi:hypothetical protein
MRRKSGRLHVRVDPIKRAEWQAVADALDMSLATFLECAADREVEKFRRFLQYRETYPQKDAGAFLSL